MNTRDKEQSSFTREDVPKAAWMLPVGAGHLGSRFKPRNHFLGNGRQSMIEALSKDQGLLKIPVLLPDLKLPKLCSWA